MLSSAWGFCFSRSGMGLRIYIITKFLEEADIAGPGKITEPVCTFLSATLHSASAKEPESVQGRTPYLLKSKIIRDFPENAHIVKLQREDGVTLC